MQRTMNTQSPIPQHAVHDAPDPEYMTHALVWPNTLSLRAKMVIQFLDDSAALYESNGRYIVREENCDGLMYGGDLMYGEKPHNDGMNTLLWQGKSVGALEAWLEQMADIYDQRDDDLRWYLISQAGMFKDLTADYQTIGMYVIEELEQMGAKAKTEEGWVDINTAFWEAAQEECLRMDFNSIYYDVEIPDVDDELGMLIHRNGEVEGIGIEEYSYLLG